MEDVRWLDEGEMRLWRAFLLSATRVLDRLDRELQASYGITLAEYEVLVFLAEADEHGERMSRLADRVLVSRSRLSYHVARLERSGYVRRHRCPSDGRGTNARLLAKGRRLLERAAPEHVASVRRYLVDPVVALQGGHGDVLAATNEALEAVVEATAAGGIGASGDVPDGDGPEGGTVTGRR